jgi:sulfur carrier protein ThiS
MLKIKVDGREQQLNIGCRTFVTLDVLLRILGSNAARVTLNGAVISSNQFETTTVNSGDSLQLK